VALVSDVLYRTVFSPLVAAGVWGAISSVSAIKAEPIQMVCLTCLRYMTDTHSRVIVTFFGVSKSTVDLHISKQLRIAFLVPRMAGFYAYIATQITNAIAPDKANHARHRVSPLNPVRLFIPSSPAIFSPVMDSLSDCRICGKKIVFHFYSLSVNGTNAGVNGLGETIFQEIIYLAPFFQRPHIVTVRRQPSLHANGCQ
jgi:hypothetical protein